MIKEILGVPGALGAFCLALVIFGFAPGLALSLILRLLPRDDPRRRELHAELYAVPRWERPFWVAEQFEVALRQGLFPEVSWFFEFWWGRLVRTRAKIESGLALHGEHPDTFWVPNAEEKADLRPGDLVKLMWVINRPRKSWPGGERMWVKITHRDGDNFVGTLDNWPVYVYLRPDETVRFHAEAIIDYSFPEGAQEDEAA